MRGTWVTRALAATMRTLAIGDARPHAVLIAMTKTHRFAYESARSGPKRPKRPPKPRRDILVDTSRPGVSATDRKAGLATTADRNVSRRAGRKATFALEDSRPPRPSRKSTRRGSNRAKPDTNLRLRSTRAARSPSSRAGARSH